MTSKRDFNEFSTTASNPTMLPEQSSKKPRYTKTIPDHTLWSLINDMPAYLRQGALYEICKANPTSAAYVQELRKKHLADKAAAARAAPPVNFDSYSKNCWYTLNIKYRNLRSSRRAILKKARLDTRWATRRNALEVLRKICKSVVLCDVQVIQHELMNSTCEIYNFAESMTRLAKGRDTKKRGSTRSCWS